MLSEIAFRMVECCSCGKGVQVVVSVCCLFFFCLFATPFFWFLGFVRSQATNTIRIRPQMRRVWDGPG